MIDRRRRRAEDEAPGAGLRLPRREPRDGGPRGAVLDLQERAGNQAVAELLTATPAGDVASVQRDAPKKDEKKAVPPPSMQIAELDLDLPITSFQRQAGGTNTPKTEGGDASVTMQSSGQAATFMKALASGQRFATITIKIGTSTVTLHDVVVSHFAVSGENETLGLSFGSMEVTGQGSDAAEGTLGPSPGRGGTPPKL